MNLYHTLKKHLYMNHDYMRAGTSSHDIDELLESGNSLDDIIAITEWRDY